MTNRKKDIWGKQFTQKEGWAYLLVWTVLISVVIYNSGKKQYSDHFQWGLITVWSLFSLLYLAFTRFRETFMRLWIIITYFIFQCIFEIVLALIYFLFLCPVHYIRKLFFKDAKSKLTNWEENIKNKDYTSMG